jgi:hypothetical protein
MSILPIILKHVRVSDWFYVQQEVIKYKKAVTSNFGLDSSILNCLQYMKECDVNVVVL